MTSTPVPDPSAGQPDTSPVDPDRACQHLEFAAVVDVGRINPDEQGMPAAYIAEITVSCAPPPEGCGEPFRWSGAPAGLSFRHPTVSVDEKTLNAPIRPASADPDFGMGLPGFAIQQVIRP